MLQHWARFLRGSQGEAIMIKIVDEEIDHNHYSLLAIRLTITSES